MEVLRATVPVEVAWICACQKALTMPPVSRFDTE